MPGLYIVLAALFGLAPWTLRRTSWQLLAAVAVVAAAVLLAGVASGARLFPWTDIPVAAFAIGAGTLVGRILHPRPQPIAVLVALLAALDSIQVFAAGAAEQPPAWWYFGMFVVSTPWHTTAIGIFDLAIIALMSEHWRCRRASLLLAVAPGLVGLALADLISGVVYGGGLPLVPFLLAGWLLSQGWRWLRPEPPLDAGFRGAGSVQTR